MTEDGEPDPYYQAIEEAFNRRRRAPLLLSPRDWALITAWKDAGVPLRVVLQGIDNCFDAFEKRPRGSRRINSLGYCRQEIDGLHELYLGIHGADSSRPDPAASASPNRTLARHLGRLSRRLKEAAAVASEAHLDPLVGAAAAAAAEVRHLKRDVTVGGATALAAEAALERLDGALLEAAGRALGSDAVRAIESEVRGALADSAGRMEREAFEATLRAARAQRLRRRTGLPRLSLFD